MINFEELWNLWNGEKEHFPNNFKGVMLASSGHVDSTALFHLFCDFSKHKKNFLAGLIHVNYGLRGQDSEDDQKLIENLARQNNLEFHALRAELPKSSPKAGFQEWARTVRYDFFDTFIRQGYVVALAHQADDLAENILFRLTRGSEIQHLGGMTRWSPPAYWRPILHLNRASLVHYLETHGHVYHHDKSNAELIYTRNKIRHQVLPVFESLNSSAQEKIIRHAEDAAAASQFIQNTLAKDLDEKGAFALDTAKSFSFPIFKQLIAVMAGRLGHKVLSFPADHLLIAYNEITQSKSRRRYNLSPTLDLVMTNHQLYLEQKSSSDRPKSHRLDRAREHFTYHFQIGPGVNIQTPKIHTETWMIRNHSQQQSLKIKVSVAKLREKIKITGCTKRWQIKDLLQRNRDLLEKVGILYIVTVDDAVHLFDGREFLLPNDLGRFIKFNVDLISITPLSIGHPY